MKICRLLFSVVVGPILAPIFPLSAAPDMGDNCYAPTKPLTPELREEFVRSISPLAVKAERDYHIPAPIIAAMSINESGYGTTKLALATNNVLSYKWNGSVGPNGRKLFTLTCQPKEDRGNVYVVFNDRADSADFTAQKLATSRYYRTATEAYRKAVDGGSDKKIAAYTWLRSIAPTYNPYHTNKYIRNILTIADDPIAQSGKLNEARNLWHLSSSHRDADAYMSMAPAEKTPAEDHVADVAKAARSAYVIDRSTNKCPTPEADLLGWPAQRLKVCEYAVGPRASLRTGHVVLLVTEPHTVATWIETACSKYLPKAGSCFATILKCAKNNSGMMIPVSGNLMEDMDGVHWKNYFFRNGMTVSIAGQANGGSDQIDMGQQRKLAAMPDAAVTKIPSGMTRFWRTRPSQFSRHVPGAGAPSTLNSSQDRQKWLEIAKSELLAALDKPENRLLEAWMASHVGPLASGVCPSD